eukprot:gene14180-biopygen549
MRGISRAYEGSWPVRYTAQGEQDIPAPRPRHPKPKMVDSPRHARASVLFPGREGKEKRKRQRACPAIEETATTRRRPLPFLPSGRRSTPVFGVRPLKSPPLTLRSPRDFAA